MSGADVKLFDLAEGDSATLTMPPVTTVQLVKYAGASGDYNRIHYDHQFAVEAGLGGVIAHGMLTMGFMASAVGRWMGPGGRVKRIAARFSKPVRPGDSVRVVATVTAVGADGARDLRLEALVADQPVASGNARVVRCTFA